MERPAKYTVNQALDILKKAGAPVRRTTLYKMINAGEISTIRILGRTFIPADDVRRLLTSHMPPPEWLTRRQAQARIGLGRSSMFKLVSIGLLHPKTIGGILYFNPAEITALEVTSHPTARPTRCTRQGRPTAAARR